mgnify:CR=1 FL=1
MILTENRNNNILMRKSIKLLVACMLCSPVAIVAQEQDSLFARKSKVAIEYGRGISFNLKESTTATAVASEEELSHKKSINNSNMLYGLIPGLQVLQNSDNAWNDAATLRVRGYGTSSSTTPLVLVDGFERSLDQISADEIESVTVLKDAASTAVFGVRGANGVVLVTTRRGTAGKPKISLNSSFGLTQALRNLKGVDSYTYATLYNETQLSDNPSLKESQLGFSPYVREMFRTNADPIMFPNVDWNDYIFKKEEVFRDYENRTEWASKMLINISKAGYFSSDRTISEYNKDIWHLQ